MAQGGETSARAGAGASATRAFVAFGANAPRAGRSPEETLRQALEDVAAEGASVAAVSRFYRTPAFPPGAGPDFVNAAAALDWSGSAGALLSLLHRIEARFGRDRAERWAPRTLDLDLIAAGDAVHPDRATFEAWARLAPERQRREAPDRMILPHPRMHERAFVLIPLADVAPDWRHPVLGRSVAQMVADLPAGTRAEVVAL